MGGRPWEADWTPELQRAWEDGLGSSKDPRASIGVHRTVTTTSDVAPPRQRTVSSGTPPPARLPSPAGVTREFSDGEAMEVRGFRPPASHRRVSVRARGDDRQLTVPEIELEAEVGAGGMGKVFRARQVSLDRAVALKLLTPNEKLPDAEAHFESEACITAVLDHPNITPVHDMGLDGDDHIFYTMKLIDGTPWDELLDARPQGGTRRGADGRDLRAHLEILIEVANAVAFAHSRGIIHRDIKPQNVMVGEYGEVILVDWGLAVALEPIAELPRVLDLAQVLVTCGTPAYMPPEISTGQREWIGRWTDVFMLGAVLYEVLYGLPPHDDSTALDSLKIASRNEWHFPDYVHPELEPYHAVLKTVVSRSLATHPHERYPDANAFLLAIKSALHHLDAAELASEAVAIYRRVESDEVQSQSVRQAVSGAVASPTDRETKYRLLARSVSVLEQALESWPENPTARHYLVEAHLLFVLIALQADDLSLASSHLGTLDQLPAGIVASEDQRERAAKLGRRHERAMQERQRKTRRMSILQVSAAALAVALLIGAGMAMLLIGNARDRARQERNHLSQLLIATASDGIEADLDGLLGPVKASLRGASDWAKAGRLDTDDPALLTSFFLPLIDGYPVIASVVRADASGYEYMLLRTKTGWQTRTVVPGERTKTFHKLAFDGTVLETWTEDVDYDPFSRPWYRGARELHARAETEVAARDRIAWTAPYTFFTTKEVGMTASLRADSPAGRQFVIGIDLTLADLSEYTQKMPESEHGKVFVMTDDDLVLGLPRGDNFATAQARRAALLRPVTEIGDEVAATAVTTWEERGRADDMRFRFTVPNGRRDKVWWAGFRSYALGLDRDLLIGVVLPESDFEVPSTP